MEPGPAPFTIFDVLGDAWRTFRRTVFSHMGWNLGFVLFATMSSCLCACGIGGVVGVIGGLGRGSEDSSIAVGVLSIVLYVGLLAAYAALFALHQGVTLAITGADLRGEPVALGACVGEATERLPSLVGAMLVRFVADLSISVPAMAGAMLVAVAIGGSDFELGDYGDAMPEGVEPLILAITIAILVAYPLSFLWAMVVRSFLGLSGPCVQIEGLGAIAALRKSVALLEGHRLQVVGLRLLWAVIAFALYVIAYVPMFAVQLLLQNEELAGLVSVILLPYMFVVYFFLLHLYSFDTVIEAAFHGRLAKKSTTEIAEVFA